MCGSESCGFKGLLGIEDLRGNRTHLLKTWSLETKGWNLETSEILVPRRGVTYPDLRPLIRQTYNNWHLILL